MGTMRERQREVQLYRGQVPSPGRPTVAWREDRVRFWAAIARGATTEDAAVEAGVSSPVAFRWFRHAGGVNPCLSPSVSGRYLSFSEREDIALLRAQGHGVRAIARRVGRSPSTITRELRRNASTRTWRHEQAPVGFGRDRHNARILDMGGEEFMERATPSTPSGNRALANLAPCSSSTNTS